MNEFHTKDIRNLSLLGHASSGKTSLVEAMLYTKEETDRLGRIVEGNTKSDYHADEKERKHSINYSLMHVTHKNKKLNIIDTPGYLDFIVISNLFIRFTRDDQLPLGFIINKLDNEDSNFEDSLNQLKASFGKNSVVPLQLPVNEGPDFNKVVDIINMVCYEYSDDNSGAAEKVDIPDSIKSQAEEIRNGLIESIAETDEELLEKFFEEETLPDEDIVAGLKRAIINREVFPVFATDAFNNIGISNLLDQMVSFVPAPDERELPETEEDVDVEVSDDSPTSCFVFQTMMEGHAGGLFFMKLMSGTLKKGMTLINTKSKESEKIGQIYVINGKNSKEIEEAHAGDLIATTKLKNTHTNTTLCEEDTKITFQKIDFPEPVIQEAIKPKSRSDEDKIKDGLQSISDEDPTFNFEFNPEISRYRNRFLFD